MNQNTTEEIRIISKNENSYFEIQSLQCQGLDLAPIQIEALKSRGLKQLTLTGLPDNLIRDSKEKILSILSRLSQWGPLERILVNLLPAEQSKTGSHHEVPLCLACLSVLEFEQLSPVSKNILTKYIFLGSLNLDAKIQHTELSQSLPNFFQDKKIIGPSHTQNFIELWQKILEGDEDYFDRLTLNEEKILERFQEVNLPAVEGRICERLLILSALAAHLHIILLGSPGTGKSYLAKWAHGLLSLDDKEEEQCVQRIWQLSGLKREHKVPCLQPHSKTFLSEFIGVQRQGLSRPGIFALAHCGILILDEFAELNKDCRENLRTVLDQKTVLRNTRHGCEKWPADFILFSTANPCPCGYFIGLSSPHCLCTPQQRQLYRQKFSGPILDRMGLRLILQNEDLKIRSLEKRKEILMKEKSEIQDMLKKSKTLIDQKSLEFYSILKQRKNTKNSERRLHISSRFLSSLSAVIGLSPRESIEVYDLLSFLEKDFI